jgi:hypothetical protein
VDPKLHQFTEQLDFMLLSVEHRKKLKFVPSFELGTILAAEDVITNITSLSANLKNCNNSVQFNSLFISLLSSTASGQLQSQHKYRKQQ